MFGGKANMGGFTVRQSRERHIAYLCRGLGYSEILTYSFISPSAYDRIALPKDSPLRRGPVILNPLGEDTSVMRTVSLPSMLEVLGRNASVRNTGVKLYELAKVYRESGDTLPDERVIITLGAYGGCDFYKIKGSVEALLSDMRVKDVSFAACAGNAAYHPGRCALISSGETVIGTVGQIHPKVAASYGLGEAFAAELDMENLFSCAGDGSMYRPLPKYPSVMRDIAVVCDEGVTVAQLTECIKKGGGKLLKDVELFDIYRGSHIPEGKKSTAFSLKLRSDDQTLTDEHADEVTKSVLDTLRSELGAVIR
jgi:phenylalanyl-tRNA synthetase beta chain